MTTKVTDLYVDYAIEITDAPLLYAQWLAYLVVSCTLNKSVWMDYGGFMKLYPNLYLLIIGPSSVYRKSFSQRLAASIVREVYDEFQMLDVSSREAFISEMARQDRTPSGCGLVLIDEMAGFMARVKTSPHFAGMIQDLSSAFTADTIERRVGVNEEEKKIYKVVDPFLNVTAACSYDWLTKSIETSDLTGGFLARFLWIVPAEKTTAHWSEAKHGDIMKRQRIVDRLNEIKSMVMGKMVWMPEAKEYWDWWYSDFRTRNAGGRWDANFERMTNQVRKVAMINAAQDTRLEISRLDLEDAVGMAEPLVGHLNDVAIGENPEEILRQRILHYMKKRATAVNRSELLNNVNGIDKKRLDAALETLMEAEKIMLDATENGTAPGRRPTKYRLREKAGGRAIPDQR